MDQQPLINITNLRSNISSAIQSIDAETIIEFLRELTILDLLVAIGFVTVHVILISTLMGYSIRYIKKPTKVELKKKKAELKAKKEKKEEVNHAWGQLLVANPDCFTTYPIFEKEYPEHHKIAKDLLERRLAISRSKNMYR